MNQAESTTRRVLIVDDEPNIVTAIEFLMQQQGLSTEHANNGERALEKVRSFRPHLIILDVMMPVMDGFEVASAIRKEEEFRDVSILFLTAKGTDKDKHDGYGAGADAYLTKPFDNDRLIEKALDMLDLEW